MTRVPSQIRPVCDGLLDVGFREDRLRLDVPIPGGDSRVSLLAFADQPFDSRTASVAVMHGRWLAEPEIAAVRPLGAPLVFVCLPDHFQLWVQGVERPRFHLRLTPRELPGFFSRHRQHLAPGAIYRAKLWGRLEHSFQLEFVDAGFLPLIEEQAGQRLKDFIERLVTETRNRLGWREVSDADGRWLLQSTFWLLAAKILQDKAVPGFVRLELSDVEEVYSRLAKHYNSEAPRPVPLSSRNRREALAAAAKDIQAFPHCGPVSTEALAYLYESALIDRTIRRKLGTHSTPTWLVDYIVGKLRPWIDRHIPVSERRVFEPACGHAGFLIAAMRLLSELLPENWHQQRRAYLRERLHGLEIDDFALEIARLSLTLADVPNPNGWALTAEDMFEADLLERGVRGATIVLGNPPFENFAADERPHGCLPNKAAETFRRVVEHLPPGGVFGFVLPQTFLHAKQAADVRRILLRDYEIAEISLFADKVFRYGEPESTVVMGRRVAQGRLRHTSVRYQRIREGHIEDFSRTYEPGSVVGVNQERFARSDTSSLLVPDLDDVWEALGQLPRFEQFADIGKGFDHKGDNDPSLPPGTMKVSPVPRGGMVPGFAGWREGQMTHQLPELVWLNLDPSFIGSERRGTTTGVPQLLVNYAPVSREAWRLKGLLDEKGHPVTSRFLIVRSKLKRLSLRSVWALCNSPVGNAYAYCASSKRDILTGDIRQMPVPDPSQRDLSVLDQAVADYLKAAKAANFVATKKRHVNHKGDVSQMSLGLAGASQEMETATAERLKFLHWRVDAEVLRLYDLPAALERKVLDLFCGIHRRGVPFEQTEYFPKDFTDLQRLNDLLAITAAWLKTNRRRAKLMDLEEAGKLTPAQAVELENLQRLADASVSLTKSPSIDEIDRTVESLKRRGVWKE